jgi:transcriptional regulator with XRE-family HTH domain
MELQGDTSFGQWLKQRRQMLDLTQRELAQQVGCAEITIQKIEANRRRPSKQIAELLAEQLDIAVNERPAFVRFARVGSSANGTTQFTRGRRPHESLRAADAIDRP